MEKLLDYLSEVELDANVGYGFIGASLLIYMGIAISKAIYWYGISTNNVVQSAINL